MGVKLGSGAHQRKRYVKCSVVHQCTCTYCPTVCHTYHCPAYLKISCLVIHAADGAGRDGSKLQKETASTASVDFSIPGSYALAHRLIHSFMSSQQQPGEGSSSIRRQVYIHTSKLLILRYCSCKGGTQGLTQMHVTCSTFVACEPWCCGAATQQG